MFILEFGLLDDHPNAEPRVMAIAIKLRVWAPIGRLNVPQWTPSPRGFNSVLNHPFTIVGKGMLVSLL